MNFISVKKNILKVRRSGPGFSLPSALKRVRIETHGHDGALRDHKPGLPRVGPGGGGKDPRKIYTVYLEDFIKVGPESSLTHSDP